MADDAKATLAPLQIELPIRDFHDTDDEQPEPIPHGLRVDIKRLRGYTSVARPLIGKCVDLPFAVRRLPTPYQTHDIDQHWFGLNVAPGLTPEHNDFILATIGQLGIQRLRVHIGPHDGVYERSLGFIEQLRESGYEVLVNVIQPRTAAIRMDQKHQQQVWREFLERLIRDLDLSEGQVTGLEHGSTINRFKWSGHTHVTYAEAARIHHDVCKDAGLPYLGPNVQDFEPIDAIACLAHLAERDVLPDVFTCNLFVDRANQPETPDPNVFGEWLADWAGMDTLGKAKVMAAVASQFGMRPEFLCTYTYWTLAVTGLPRRRYVSLDQYARYMVRYSVMLAASGYCSGMYWGTPISYSKGLIDDGTAFKPEPPAAHHLWYVRGEVEDYCLRPGFFAYGELVRLLSGARYKRKVQSKPFVHVHQFERSDGIDVLVAWTEDGYGEKLRDVLPEAALESITEVLSIYGEGKDDRAEDVLLTEEPVYVMLTRSDWRESKPRPEPTYVWEYSVPANHMMAMVPVAAHGYGGRVLAKHRDSIDFSFLQHLEQLPTHSDATVHVEDIYDQFHFEVSLPGNALGFHDIPKVWLVLLTPFAGESRDAWNTACELLSRNIQTFRPIVGLKPIGMRGIRDRAFTFDIAVFEVPAHFQALDAMLSAQQKEHVLTHLGEYIHALHGCGVSSDAFHQSLLMRREEDQFQFLVRPTLNAEFHLKTPFKHRVRDLAALDLPKDDLVKVLKAYTRSSTPNKLWKQVLSHQQSWRAFGVSDDGLSDSDAFPKE